MERIKKMTERFTIKMAPEDILQIQEAAERAHLAPTVYARKILLDNCNPLLTREKWTSGNGKE